MFERHRTTHAFLTLSLLCLLAAAGCSGMQPGMQSRGNAGIGGPDVLRLEMRDQSVLTFQDDAWRLTMRGVEGTAHVEQSDGIITTKDTTASWFDIASAAGTGRGKTTSQFLLTVLGVILVIGLAAIVLYAAFLATDR